MFRLVIIVNIKLIVKKISFESSFELKKIDHFRCLK